MLVRYAARAHPQCAIFVGQVGGAITRVAPERTAYPHLSRESSAAGSRLRITVFAGTLS
jgi:hypothetical protein